MTIYGQAELTTNPTNADETVNTMVRAGRDAANATKEWTVAGDFTATEAETYAGYVHELNGSPAAPFAFGVYPVARKFAVINNTGKICTVYVQGQSGSGVAVSAEAGVVVELYSDGVNVAEVSTGVGGGGGAGAKTLITETVTSGSASEVTFSSIPSTYRDLELRVRGRGTTAASDINVRVQFNGDTGNNYNSIRHYLTGNGQVGGNEQGTASLFFGSIPAASATSGYAGVVVGTISDYRGTTFNKAFSSVAGESVGNSAGNTNFQGSGGIWRNSAAISSIRVFLSAGNFENGCVASLYGHM